MSLEAATKEDAVSKAADQRGHKRRSGPQPRSGGVKPAVRPRDARQTRFAQSFAQIVAVLMRDPNFRNMRLADLEWLVLPPVMAGQFSLAQAPSPHGRAKEGGARKAASWCRWRWRCGHACRPPSTRACRRTSTSRCGCAPVTGPRGDNVWLMAVAGDQRAVPKFLEQLAETEFKGQRVKMRLRGPDNKVVVKTLGQAA